mmetsp:Transcript_106556/g.311496  ORF Transcript_106556/g.311496 Transcript_106556/m.311496 type:complete len:235 (+) Transcript_106556:117-821(+)
MRRPGGGSGRCRGSAKHSAFADVCSAPAVQVFGRARLPGRAGPGGVGPAAGEAGRGLRVLRLAPERVPAPVLLGLRGRGRALRLPRLLLRLQAPHRQLCGQPALRPSDHGLDGGPHFGAAGSRPRPPCAGLRRVLASLEGGTGVPSPERLALLAANGAVSRRRPRLLRRSIIPAQGPFPGVAVRHGMLLPADGPCRTELARGLRLRSRAPHGNGAVRSFGCGCAEAAAEAEAQG